jgi:hypothetical protein
MTSYRAILTVAIVLLASVPLAQGGSALINPASQGPIATFSPTKLNFGNVKQGTRVTGTISVMNTGNSTLDLYAILQTKPSKGDLTLTTTCSPSIPLAPGASCTVTLTWLAVGTPGPMTGSILFTDNAPGSPQSVPLRGRVVQ